MLRHHGAAHDHFRVRLFLAQQPDRVLHTDYGCSHQRAQADQPDLLSDGCLDDRLRRHVFAKIQNLEAVILKHDLDNILAYVMDVALDRCKDHPPFRRLLLPLHGLLDHFKSRLGSLSAHQQLR